MADTIAPAGAGARPNGRSWYSMRAKAANSAEIFVYDEIGFFGIRAADFIRDLKALGDDITDLQVRINSPGGDVFDGLAIHNSLKRHKAKVTVLVDGIAASIASVIAMAGDEVLMPANAMLMIHDPSGIVLGTADDMRGLADALDKIKLGLISAYRDKSGLPDDEIARIMSDETWLTADEAVDLGLADRVEEPLKLAARLRPLKGSLHRHFRNIPKELEHAMSGQTETPPGTPAPEAMPAAEVVRAMEAVGAAGRAAGLIDAKATRPQVEAAAAAVRDIKAAVDQGRKLWPKMPDEIANAAMNASDPNAARKLIMDKLADEDAATSITAHRTPAQGGRSETPPGYLANRQRAALGLKREG